MKKIRKAICKGAKEILQNKYSDFENQCYRKYAKRLNKYNTFIRDRYTEFNFTNQKYKTIEYRSFNLLGCQNNEEIKKMYKMALKTIQDILLSELNNKKTFLEITKKQYIFNNTKKNIIKQKFKNSIIKISKEKIIEFLYPKKQKDNFTIPNLEKQILFNHNINIEV